MATAKNPLQTVGTAVAKGAGWQGLVLKESSDEFFFAVVRHALISNGKTEVIYGNG
jgi:hypothetical protein